MHWQYLTLALLVVGPLAACHSGGGVAPDRQAPTPAAPIPSAPAPETTPPPPASVPASPVPSEPAPPVPEQPAPASADCDARRAAIETALNDAARCTRDADCTTMLPGCPFGCYRPVNKDISLTQINADIDAYNGACNQCMYRCIPAKGGPRCNAGRCAIGGA